MYQRVYLPRKKTFLMLIKQYPCSCQQENTCNVPTEKKVEELPQNQKNTVNSCEFVFIMTNTHRIHVFTYIKTIQTNNPCRSMSNVRRMDPIRTQPVSNLETFWDYMSHHQN